jgi:peptidoglycan/xylan/chitin deacetylase (PgdA/CDA1 family)
VKSDSAAEPTIQPWAAFTLTFDLELMWGWHDLEPAAARERKARSLRGAKDRIRALIDRLEAQAIPSTWATATHLFLESCAGHDDHPDRPWLERDPRSDAVADPLWYAPELLDRLIGSRVDVEIGCHSFSHAPFDEIGADGAEYELRKSAELARKRGLELRAFVFPRNREGHHALLSEYGYRVYRTSTPVPKGSRRKRVLDLLLDRITPEPVHPFVDEHGMVAIPPSLNLGQRFSLPHRLLCKSPPRNYIRWALREGLARTAANGGVFHVWMHPSEWGTSVREDDFGYMIDLVRGYRDRGRIEILTMSQVAARVAGGF